MYSVTLIVIQQSKRDFYFAASTLQELALTTTFPSPPQFLYRFSYRATHALWPQCKASCLPPGWLRPHPGGPLVKF